MVESLKSMRTEVRALLDGQDAANSLWSDSELNSLLNQGASLACRQAQQLQYPFQMLTVAGVGQYATEVEVTDIISVGYHDGSNYRDLDPMAPKEANRYSQSTTSFPTRFYKAPYIANYTYQGSDNNIIVTPLGPRSRLYRSVIGVDPIPDTAGHTITVLGYLQHPKMRKDSQMCLLPDGFEDCAKFFAIGKALLKEKFYDESNHFFKLYANMIEKLMEYNSQGSIGHAEVKDPTELPSATPYPHEIWVD